MPSPEDLQIELGRLKTSPAYLRLREKHLYEYRRATEELQSANLADVPGLQARIKALCEVLELPNQLYRQAGGNGEVFEPVAKSYVNE